MNSRDLARWARLHERRARAAKWWTAAPIAILAAGAMIAAWVGWRAEVAPTPETMGALASRAWLIAAMVAFGVAFLRVPFHLYWRGDSALLAQLPVEGVPLFDAALVRCVRGAVGTTFAVAIGAVPLVRALPVELVLRHVALAAVMGVAAATLVPAVVVYAASIVALGSRAPANARGAGPVAPAGAARQASAAPILGAIPGGLGAIVIVLALLVAPWLTGGVPHLRVEVVAALLVGGSAMALVAARRLAGRAMSQILRDVAALDRQRLATLELRPPTGIERRLARLAGAGALVYAKDARLVRRRYPLAFALGATSFLALVLVAVAAPDDPVPYLVAVLVGSAAYGVVLSGRLVRAPIEPPRLLGTLPIARSAVRRAKLVWIGGWWGIFLGIPGLAAVLRAPSLAVPAVLLVGTTALVLGTGALRGREA